MKKNFFPFSLLVLCVILLSACPQAQQAHSTQENTMRNIPYQPAEPDQPLQTLLPADYQKSKVHFLIEKSKYRLRVLYQAEAQAKEIKSYPVVFGFGAGPDKRREGDGATPEGSFRIRNLYPHPSWRYFIWFDYPTAESLQKHQQAKATGLIPADATVGGEVGIHGVPAGQDALILEGTNWTAGCIALSDAHIQEIYQVAQKGQQITIQP